METPRPRIAFLFRYGPTDHSELFHVIPQILARLCDRYEVHYFGLNKPRFNAALFDSRIRFHLWPIHVNRASNRDKFLKTAFWYLLLPWIGLRCRRMKIDLIYVDENVPLTGAILLASANRPLVISVADFFLEVYGETYPVLRWVAKIVHRLEFRAWRRLAGIFVHAEATKRFLVGKGVDPGRVLLVRDPCEDAKYFPKDGAEHRRKLGFSDSDVVLVHHGILHPNKGIGRVLEYVQPLMATNPRLKLLIVGGGLELDRIRRMASDLKIDSQIVFTGWLPSFREVNDCLNAADIGLVMRVGQFSDHFHATGTLIHCLACGLPVLAARLDGIAEVVKEDDNGLLFDPANGAEFRSKLSRLVDQPALRTRLGERGKLTAQEMFNPERVIDGIVKGLEQFESRNSRAA